jgi:cytochrome c biogenesis protein CcmG/thiol:disulfide interchange protein DsbE
LAELGDPFERVGSDPSGRAGIDWGVYGVPETYIVDPAGRIRYKHVGPLREEDIASVIAPVLRRVAR